MAMIFLCALLLVASTCVSKVQCSMCAEVAHRQSIFCEDGTYGRYIWSQSISTMFTENIQINSEMTTSDKFSILLLAHYSQLIDLFWLHGRFFGGGGKIRILC